MNFPLILNHHTKSQLEALLKNPKSSYVFLGVPELGKYKTAIEITKILNCKPWKSDDCQICESIESGNYPDLILISPENKTSIGISQIQQLQSILSLNNYSQIGTRVVIIYPSDKMTEEAQNCLLKLLEEPPLGTIIILICEDEGGLLSTITSRCQLIRFGLVEDERIRNFLVEKYQSHNLPFNQIIAFSNGKPGLAIKLAENQKLLDQYKITKELADRILSADLFAKLVLVSKLDNTDFDQSFLIQFISFNLTNALRTASKYNDKITLNKLTTKLAAIEKYHQYIEANVKAKNALEGLMLEL